MSTAQFVCFKWFPLNYGRYWTNKRLLWMSPFHNFQEKFIFLQCIYCVVTRNLSMLFLLFINLLCVSFFWIVIPKLKRDMSEITSVFFRYLDNYVVATLYQYHNIFTFDIWVNFVEQQILKIKWLAKVHLDILHEKKKNTQIHSFSRKENILFSSFEFFRHRVSIKTPSSKKHCILQTKNSRILLK